MDGNRFIRFDALSGTRCPEKGLKSITALNAFDELIDGLRLIAAHLIAGGKLEFVHGCLVGESAAQRGKCFCGRRRADGWLRRTSLQLRGEQTKVGMQHRNVKR